jgi:RNA polymerase sigma factor (sigma-70 family)
MSENHQQSAAASARPPESSTEPPESSTERQETIGPQETSDQLLAERFEAYRDRLARVAYRILGSASEADDAVQEAWLRFSRSDTGTVENLGGWLTTVVSRVCLNMLQARRSRPEVPLDPDGPGAGPEPAAGAAAGTDPEHEAFLADSIGLALLVVLDQLSPPERVSFVLHDMFAVPFTDIAPIVGRTPQASRQLASRARRRVQGQDAPGGAGPLRQARLVEAFLAAARHGDFAALLAVLDPDVAMRADQTAVRLGATAELRGARDVAQFCRRAQGARPVLVDGSAGVAWVQDGDPRVIFRFTVGADAITGIELIADQDRLRQLDLVFPAATSP